MNCGYTWWVIRWNCVCEKSRRVYRFCLVASVLRGWFCNNEKIKKVFFKLPIVKPFVTHFMRFRSRSLFWAKNRIEQHFSPACCICNCFIFLSLIKWRCDKRKKNSDNNDCDCYRKHLKCYFWKHMTEICCFFSELLLEIDQFP